MHSLVFPSTKTLIRPHLTSIHQLHKKLLLYMVLSCWCSLSKTWISLIACCKRRPFLACCKRLKTDRQTDRQTYLWSIYIFWLVDRFTVGDYCRLWQVDKLDRLFYLKQPLLFILVNFDRWQLKYVVKGKHELVLIVYFHLRFPAVFQENFKINQVISVSSNMLSSITVTFRLSTAQQSTTSCVRLD